MLHAKSLSEPHHGTTRATGLSWIKLQQYSQIPVMASAVINLKTEKTDNLCPKELTIVILGKFCEGVREGEEK